MRLRKIDFSGIFGGSGYRSPLLSYLCVYAIVVLEFIYYMARIPSGYFTPDSFTYVDASYSVCAGELHLLRTPVLPSVIALMRALFGVGFQTTALVILQSAVFLISVHYLRRILEKFGIARKVVFWATAVYAVMPGFNSFCTCVLTEAFAVEFVVFFMWALMRDIPSSPSWRSTALSGGWLIVLVYLRPVMMCLMPVYLIFWIGVFIKRKRRAVASVVVALGMLLVCAVSLVAYKSAMHRKFGINSLTFVSACNNYFLAREAGVLTPEYTENSVFKEYLEKVSATDIYDDKGLVKFEEFGCVRHSLGLQPAEIEQAVNSALADNRIALVKAIVKRVAKIYRWSLLPEAPFFPLNLITFVIPFNLWAYVVFMALAFIWIVRRRRPLEVWTLWFLSAAVSGAAIVGAMSEFTRLFMPGMAAALVLFAVMLNAVYHKIKSSDIAG